jgi:MOSC domain-containing protein YiiM
LTVTCPRIPCNTFRSWIGARGWLKTFTTAARPGAYLSVSTPGVIRTGDPVQVVFRPEHAVSIAVVFRSQTLERELAELVLTAGDYLDPETRAMAQRQDVFKLG